MQEASMSTYDPNRNRPVETGSDYTGWIIGAIVVIAIVIGVFVWAPWGNGGGNQTASTSPATTSAPAGRETTGVGGAPARAPASAPASAPAATPPAANR
jgi:hypothetical protein